jgi:hypothetical protein
MYVLFYICTVLLVSTSQWSWNIQHMHGVHNWRSVEGIQSISRLDTNFGDIFYNVKDEYLVKLLQGYKTHFGSLFAWKNYSDRLASSSLWYEVFFTLWVWVCVVRGRLSVKTTQSLVSSCQKLVDRCFSCKHWSTVLQLSYVWVVNQSTPHVLHV